MCTHISIKDKFTVVFKCTHSLKYFLAFITLKHILDIYVKSKVFCSFAKLFVQHWVLAMEEEEGPWRRTGYSVQRQILDEQTVDEIAEKSDSKSPVSEKIKKSMRYLICFIA